jgi:hypothetical protein
MLISRCHNDTRIIPPLVGHTSSVNRMLAANCVFKTCVAKSHWQHITIAWWLGGVWASTHWLWYKKGTLIDQAAAILHVLVPRSSNLLSMQTSISGVQTGQHLIPMSQSTHICPVNDEMWRIICEMWFRVMDNVLRRGNMLPGNIHWHSHTWKQFVRCDSALWIMFYVEATCFLRIPTGTAIHQIYVCHSLCRAVRFRHKNTKLISHQITITAPTITNFS